MKRIILWLGIVVAVLLVALLAVPFLIDANRFKPTLESQLSSALGRSVTFGNLKLSIFSGTVNADDLSIGEDPAFGKTPFLLAKSLNVGVELWPFIFSRKLHVTGITVQKPDISLVQSSSGEWNFASLGGAPAKSVTKPTPSAVPPPTPAASNSAGASAVGMDLSVRLVKIADGRLTIRGASDRKKPLTLEGVNIEVQNFTSTAAFPFSLSTKVVGGGAVKLDGKAGPINHEDASKTPVNATLSASEIDLAGTGLNEMAPDIAGLVSLDGTADSDGNVVKINGEFKADKLKLAKTGTPAAIPVGFDFALEHHMRKQSGTLRRGDIHIGKASARLNGDYAQQQGAMVLKMNFSGPDMSVEELSGMLPALGVVLPKGSSLKEGTLTATASLVGPADKLDINGTVNLNKTTLKGFDLGQKMATIQKLAGLKAGPDTEIQTASANLRVTPAGAVAEQIRFIVPAIGELSGGGTISPANALDFKMTAKVHTTGAAAIIADTPIPFFVQGTSADPVFKPDLKSMATDKIKEITGGSTKPSDVLKGLFGGKKD